MTELMQFVGELGASSFIVVAFGDFVEKAGDIIVQKLIAPRGTLLSEKIVIYWEVVKDLYGDLREFLDRLSLYSRPRQLSPKVEGE